MGYIDKNGGYYEGHRQFDDLEVADRPSTYHQWVDGEWVFDAAKSKGDRIAKLQATYEVDRAKLNMAWLSAIISDGAPEAARKAIITGQMTDLSTQLNANILAIIMEA